MDPTFQGFIWWVQAVMGVPNTDMPSNDTLQVAYDEAINLAYTELSTIPSQATSFSIYAQAVYNLGGAFLLEIAPDQPGQTFWSDLRNKLNINSFVPGFINQAHDQGTGEGMYIIKQLAELSLLGLQLIKSPWGRRYLEFAGQWGPIWGLTI